MPASISQSHTARGFSSGRVVRRAAAFCALSACLLACSSEESSDDAGAIPPGTGTSVNPTTMGDAAPPSGGNTPPPSMPEAGMTSTSGNSRPDTGVVTPARDAGGDAAVVADASVPLGDAATTGEGGAPVTGGACTREVLAAAVDSFYKALTAHDPKLINASPSIKLTQDGKSIMLGEGLMKTAGMVKFKRSALDTVQCETVTESVVANSGSDFVVGVRLKVSAGQISEVESILVGPDGWFPNPGAVVSSASDNWENILPDAERMTRDKIKKDIVDGYFIDLFAGDIEVAEYPFATECKRAENGFSPGACNFGIPTLGAMMPLHYVVDIEAGIGVGFVLFGGRASGMLDFHMFRVKSGKVYGVRAVVGPSVMGRGWPSDPAAMP